MEPKPTLARRDAAPLKPGRWTPVTIPLYAQGHAYRTGSRLRVTVSAPGGDQPIWAFGETVPATGRPAVSIARTRAGASSVLLPVVPGVTIPTALPPCPGLRGQPCRPYAPTANRTAR